jgi:PAS domain S-box-containing protein
VYGFALGALAVALLIRVLLTLVIGSALPFITIFGAVAVAVWLGGSRPAFLVAALGYIGCGLLLAPSGGGMFAFQELGGVAGLAAYTFTCGLITVIGEVAHASQVNERVGRELLRVTFQSIGDAVITTDGEGRVLTMNPVAESLTGWSAAEASGKPLDAVFRIVHEETRRPADNPAEKALREGTVVGLANHTVLIRKDGSECHIDDSAAPIRDAYGDVSGCVLVFRDVTERRRVERTQADQLTAARLLASIIEFSDDGIVSKSLDGTIRSWNAGAERIFGYPAREVIGRHISLIIPPERIAEEDAILANLSAGKLIDHFETERVRADGRRIMVSLTISPIKDEHGHVVGASKIVRDITRQREAEADRAKFVTLVENSTDFIAMCDLQGRPFFVNRAGLELVGLRDMEAARNTPVASFFFPEDQPRVVNEFLPMVLREGRGELEIRFRHFTTGEARWMAYKVVTLPDASGRPVAFATVSQDVTERRKLTDDLRRLAADLSEADRRKNQFLAMLAHELRNPLAPISNAARALRTGVRDGQSVEAASALLERQVSQMSRLVDDLLDMSRITQGKIELRKERVTLAPVIEQAVEMVRGFCDTMNHQLTVTLPSAPVQLSADPARLAQVVGNLLNNACKFTNKGGRISLTATEEGDEIVIRVRDNGIGIAAEELPRLFDLFSQVESSLDRSREGLGIGLTLVRSLVELHGGTVSVHSDGLDRGTEFTVRLPHGHHELTPDQPAPVKVLQRGKRRVLIVDDSEDGALSLAMLLEIEGHEPHVVHDGFSALEAAERLRPDVVFLDIGLPGLNGYEVCRRMRRAPGGKDLMIVALTGFGQAEDRQRSHEAGFDAHLVKPAGHADLVALLSSSSAEV